MSTPRTIKITHGQILDPYTGLNCKGDIYIAEGKIAAVFDKSTNNKQAPFDAELTIDATDSIICPSLVDLNVHLREPGFEKKANIKSELSAAASAGVGHLACQPSCSPTIDTSAVASLILDKAENAGQSIVYPIGALTQGLKGEHLSEMKSLFDAGCAALTNAYANISSLNVMRHCYEYAATFNIPVIIYPQIHELAHGACAHEGEWATKMGLPGIPETAETIAVSTQLLLIEQTGVRAHFSQLSSAKSVALIEQAKQNGQIISADVCAHQLFLSEESLESYNSLYHLRPPLRTQEDKEGLRKGIVEGTISAICSSHQPHEAAAKFSPFPSSESGISSIETLLPLAGKLSEETELPLIDMISRLTKGPAEILNIPQKGIFEGNLADLCIFKTNEKWTLKSSDLLSAGKNNPFIGQQFNHRVSHTFVNGKMIFSRD